MELDDIALDDIKTARVQLGNKVFSLQETGGVDVDTLRADDYVEELESAKDKIKQILTQEREEAAQKEQELKDKVPALPYGTQVIQEKIALYQGNAWNGQGCFCIRFEYRPQFVKIARWDNDEETNVDCIGEIRKDLRVDMVRDDLTLIGSIGLEEGEWRFGTKMMIADNQDVNLAGRFIHFHSMGSYDCLGDQVKQKLDGKLVTIDNIIKVRDFYQKTLEIINSRSIANSEPSSLPDCHQTGSSWEFWGEDTLGVSEWKRQEVWDL